MSNKRFTAQEMREMANAVLNECTDEENGLVYESRVIAGHVFYPDEAAAMLRQAADADDENTQLKERLESVMNDNTKMTNKMLEIVNLCNRMKDDFSSWNQVAADFAQNVLRLARGEGGAE